MENERVKIYDALMTIQSKLKAPKGQTNEYGKYRYRSCEDILEAVKPLLAETETVLTLTDEIVEINGRFYVKATARLSSVLGDYYGGVSNTAYAREEETKKDMDASQITGSCSSYARKYALNGLFLIDDTKDADTRDNREPEQKEQEPPKEPAKAYTKKDAEKELKQKVTEKDVQKLIKECEQNGVEVAKICRLYKVSGLPELSEYQLRHIHEHWEQVKGAK